MSVIFSATPTNAGNLIFENNGDLFKYCMENIGKEQLVTIEDAARQTPKMKLYSYYHKVVLRNHAVRAFRAAGYNGEDEVVTDYRLRSMFAKIHLKKPDGTFDIAIEDKKQMSLTRLLNYVNDVIHFLETELNEQVADSAEYKQWLATGKPLKKII